MNIIMISPGYPAEMAFFAVLTLVPSTVAVGSVLGLSENVIGERTVANAEDVYDALPGGWVVEHPPFDGSGFAPGEGTPIREFKVDSQRLPHGAEIYRFDRSGRRALVALFDADGARWAAV